MRANVPIEQDVIGQAMSMYVNDHGLYPIVRRHEDPKIRWGVALSDYVGGSIENELRESSPGNGNRISNNVFRCPSIANSYNQLDQVDEDGNALNRADYMRTGSYGYNWTTFGPFYPNPDFRRRYPVGEGRIKRPVNTIIVADAFGEVSMDNMSTPTRLIRRRCSPAPAGVHRARKTDSARRTRDTTAASTRCSPTVARGH